MEKNIYESRSGRKTVFKSKDGIQIKPMLYLKLKNNSQNITYYYVHYVQNESANWEIVTNPYLYGEKKQ